MNPRSACVITGTAQLRESLLVLLRTLPQIGAVHQAEDVASALGMEVALPPSLVLLDHDLPASSLCAVAVVKTARQAASSV